MRGEQDRQTHNAAAELRSLVARFAPSWALDKGYADDEPIGPQGLALDSVAVVELLVACEQQFGLPFPDTLLEGAPLTVGKLIDHLLAGGRRSGAG
jgi:acyl carrier protein